MDIKLVGRSYLCDQLVLLSDLLHHVICVCPASDPVPTAFRKSCAGKVQ